MGLGHPEAGEHPAYDETAEHIKDLKLEFLLSHWHPQVIDSGNTSKNYGVLSPHILPMKTFISSNGLKTVLYD